MEESSRVGRELPQARVQKSKRNWLLWLIPLGAVALCVWFVYRDYISTGPMITLSFQDAEGLEKENTQLIFRGAQVGQVKKISLAADNKSVEVKVRLAGFARDLAKVGSVFWIVRPQVKIGAISGLRTIVAGEYIAIQPGTGAPTNYFSGAEKQPIAQETNPLLITLTVPNLGSLQEQSPVFYRGLPVGEVTHFELSSRANQVVIHARIREQYAPLVRMDSKFWNAGGFDFHFGLFKGVQLTAESPKTIISGGIEFATPNDFQEAATNGTRFLLNEKAEEKWKTWSPVIELKLPPSTIPMTETNELSATGLR